MAIHIGEKIKKRAEYLRITSSELGRLINTSKQNVAGIYKRASLDSLLLYEISKVLSYDFFAIYDRSKMENVKEDACRKELEFSKKEIALLQKELESVKEKLELLKENNALLKSIRGDKKNSGTKREHKK